MEQPRKISSCGQRFQWYYAATSERCFQKFDDTCPGFNRFGTYDECKYRCITNKANNKFNEQQHGIELKDGSSSNKYEEAYTDDSYNDDGETDYTDYETVISVIFIIKL